MYKLVKIDLLDTYIFADIFEDTAYTTVKESENLEELFAIALEGFKELNPSFHNYEEWTEKAEDGAYELEIFDEDSKSVFRASMVLLSPQTEIALSIAYKYHKGQIRKGDGKQYLLHILEISRFLFRQGFGPLIVTAAICHDLLEDTACTPEELEKWCAFPVRRLVQFVSNDPTLETNKDWEKKKLKYIENVKSGGLQAIAVCIADKIVNLHSLLKAYKLQGEEIWKKFNRGKEKKLWFEKKVLAMAKENWDNPMLETYEQLLEELEKLNS